MVPQRLGLDRFLIAVYNIADPDILNQSKPDHGISLMKYKTCPIRPVASHCYTTGPTLRSVEPSSPRLNASPAQRSMGSLKVQKGSNVPCLWSTIRFLNH